MERHLSSPAEIKSCVQPVFTLQGQVSFMYTEFRVQPGRKPGSMTVMGLGLDKRVSSDLGLNLVQTREALTHPPPFAGRNLLSGRPLKKTSAYF